MAQAPRSYNTYAFKNASEEAKTQLSQLEAFLDPVTTACLDSTGVGPGAVCLEIGPGGGSVACWTADRVGPDGRVTAVDINPVHVPERQNLEVVRHDVRQGVPGGPYDLIHARLVLSHIVERREILKSLVGLLNPGGALAIGEFVRDPVRVVVAPDDAGAALYAKVAEAIYDGLSDVHGVDLRWGYDVFALMAEAGLTDVRGREHAETWTGGSGGSRFLHSNSFQLEKLIRGGGVSAQELDRYRELVLDPGFTVKSNQFVNTWGRKPG
ncbi:MAG: class I SAM-dependent methyltransferase [Stackebrandtia sp.]